MAKEKKLALKKIYRPLPTKIIHLQMSGEQHRRIGQYRALYKEVNRDDISEKEVILLGLDTFFSLDAVFQERLKEGNLVPLRDEEGEDERVVANGHDRRGKMEREGNQLGLEDA